LREEASDSILPVYQILKYAFWVIPFSVTPSNKKVVVVFVLVFFIFCIKIPFQRVQELDFTEKIDQAVIEIISRKSKSNSKSLCRYK
jgi:hypothetical protein